MVKFDIHKAALSCLAVIVFGCQSVKHQPDVNESKSQNAMAQTHAEDVSGSLKQATEPEPDNEETYYRMGLDYAEKQDYDKAIESYKKATELKPDYAIAYTAMGLAYAMKQDYDKAIESWKETIKYNPYDVLAYYNIGDAYKRKGDEAKEKEYKLKAEKLME
jgi:tetratricopeptide (TPR) repeat protein